MINYDFVNAVENAAHPENLRSYEHRIYEKLSFGEKNAVQAFELAADLGILPRDINAIIRRMRKKGIYICSSQLGYFLPENPEELNRKSGHLASKNKVQPCPHARVLP